DVATTDAVIAADQDPRLSVARDRVSPTDAVPGPGIVEVDTVAAVGNLRAAISTQADHVAGHRVLDCTRPEDLDTVLLVAGDHVVGDRVARNRASGRRPERQIDGTR